MVQEGSDRTLPEVGEPRRLRLGSLTITGRRRRPSGERPPVPRTLRISGWMWVLSGLAVLLAWLSLFLWPQTQRLWYRVDHEVVFWLADLRTGAATTTMKALQFLGSEWMILILRWGTILVLVIFRRWRHLLAFVVAVTLLESFVNVVNLTTIRERPLAVEIIGEWSGSSHPSQPVASLAVTLVAMRYSLLPTNWRWKTRWIVAALVVGTLGVAQLYLGVDHPTDVLFAALIATTIGVLTFRLLTPATIFPVSYQRKRPAHLELGTERRRVIGQAFGDQMGIEVQDIQPFGLEGSAGSTPLCITVRDESGERCVFAKLYASTHLRSDRWYKLARTILYGYLEDEVHFNSVTRLVEYEDYMLRLMQDAGLRAPEPYGFVELIPEEEYLIVTEFIDGGQEMEVAEVSDVVIDSALGLIRQMWDARLAHRDIKPANVLVVGEEVWLIDVAFATARPTPWRQAVDLANMMLILALHEPPQHVYERAQQWFTPTDVAEAFAATQSITMPTQLRAKLREHQMAGGIDLVAAFRELAPAAVPVAVQRWSMRRLALSAAVLAGFFSLALLVAFNIRQAGFL